MSDIVIIAKKEFHKDYQYLEKVFVSKHKDYFQLSILLKIIQNYNLDYQFFTWDEFRDSEKIDCNLVIIPQRMFLSGPVPTEIKCWTKLDILKKNGTNFLFLHHPDYEFINKKFLDLKAIDYFSSPVLEYSITEDKAEKLIDNIKEIISREKSASDEFTYFTTIGNKFISLIEKIPTKIKSSAPKKFVCFGYQNYPSNNRAFFVDIHSVGSRKKINGILFEQIINNITNTIFGTANIEDKILSEINNSNISETEKKALIDSRLGQGKFRKLLIDYWKGCSVSGLKSIELLKASHIKPWKVSNNFERLDRYNGFLFQPNIDTLFDKGLITFADNGNIILSKHLSKKDFSLLGIKLSMNINIHKNHLKYLEYHRNTVFKK